jgi:hypothetical protein
LIYASKQCLLEEMAQAIRLSQLILLSVWLVSPIHALDRLEITGTIDGTDQIIVTQNQAEWLHFFGDLNATSVSMNNIAWNPSANPILPNSGDTLFLSNRVNFMCAMVTLSEGRDTVVLERFPNHIKVSFADTPGGPSNYRIIIDFQVAPALLFDGDIDGSDELHVSYAGARWIHKHWSLPGIVYLNAVRWDLSVSDYLTNAGATTFLPQPVHFENATLSSSFGRDLLTMRSSSDGMFVNFADNPVGAGHYNMLVEFPDHNAPTNSTIAVISAASIAPTPSIGVTISTVRGVWYELESAFTLSSGEWTGTGAFVRGNGDYMTLFDPTQLQAARFYRIVSRPNP